MIGVFTSCIESFYNTTKKERDQSDINLTRDLGTNRFWMDQSCLAFVEMIEKLISRSKIARDEFYHFIHEKVDEEDMEMDDLVNNRDVSKKTEGKELAMGIGGLLDKTNSDQEQKLKNDAKMARLLNWGKVEDDPFEVKNKNLIGMLMRVQQDCLLFLSTNPTQKPIWWNVFLIYEKLCSFFKNMCENNHLKFKNYLGTFTPLTKDHEWNTIRLNFTEIFDSQLNYLLNSTRLAYNKDPVMNHSDQYRRVRPLL